MGQICCKPDETKVTQPTVLGCKKPSFRFKLTDFLIAPLTSARPPLLFGQDHIEDLLSPKSPSHSIDLKISCLIRKTF